MQPLPTDGQHAPQLKPGALQRPGVAMKVAPIGPFPDRWVAQAAPAEAGGISERGQAQMRQLLARAQQASVGRRPDGRCYAHVWRFIQAAGYGKLPQVGIPDSHATYARQFAECVNQDPARFGLQRLPISNPYEAPAGAIVVVGPGSPGTSHPRAGDIAVADGRGGFFNGGEMGYGGARHFPPGNGHVLGIYAPL